MNYCKWSNCTVVKGQLRRFAYSPFHRFTSFIKMAFTRGTALEFLRRAHEQNRLAHAYLITGPSGSGKELLAAE